MSWHEFVFSQKIKTRFNRHLFFWIVWWVYFFVVGIFLPNYLDGFRQRAYLSPGVTDVIKLTLTLFIQVLACYAIIYFLMPRYLLKARYFVFLAGIICCGLAVILATHFITATVIPLIETTLFNTPLSTIRKTTWWTSIYAGGINSIKIIAAAAAIKLGKHWWYIQKENERLDKERIEAELQLLKAQIHPRFLFNTLSNIYSFALTASPKAPEMLLKLSDTLSYMLYECDDREVSLEKEIKILRDYMMLEKMRYGDTLEMSIKIDGDTSHDKIAPLLLLRFAENSFLQSSSQTIEQAWINLEMQIENHVLEMKLMNGKPLESIGSEDREEDDLVKAEKRLHLLYPGRYTLKITEEPEIAIIALQIQLKSLVQ
jgi:Histidine kinase